MKVLFIASKNKGAVSPVVGNQAESLRADGVEVEFYLLEGRGFRGYLRNIKPLRSYLRTHQYDAMHVHYSLSAFIASLAGAKPLVVSLMGSDMRAAGWYKMMIRLFAFLFRWKTIIVKSNSMYRDLGIKRVTVIPNGVNMERFSPKPKAESQEYLGWDKTKKHVLFPAKITRPEKDYELALAAVTQMPNAELHAFENTPNEETPYWYNAADVVLMTSKWEGSPNAIKEAMACNRPIVATNVGDIAERVANVEGCYVVPCEELRVKSEERQWMIEELAKSIEEAMTYEETKGREKIIADGLDVKEINQRLISIYR